MAIFAHPDDEAFGCGGALARYARDHRVVLVSATRGEQGEISDPSLATRATLAEVRERELREAARVLGVDDVRFLGYRDSGMEGKVDDPRALVNADEREVVGRLVAILREVQPAVVITFEPSGGYGHPDHVAISRLATLAVDAGSDAAAYPDAGPPASPTRLFYSGIPRGLLRQWLADAREMGIDHGQLESLDLEQVC
ncbi:MAG: PIG-L family deacetylase, partial [Thermomicrobiaceae bacterium]|nr:PIG-L family deacetylase [Thermomicrobiaceae bacterium]